MLGQWKTRIVFSTFLVACFCANGSVWALESTVQNSFTIRSCQSWSDKGVPATLPGYESTTSDSSPIKARGGEIGTKFRLQLNDTLSLVLDVVGDPARPQQFISMLFSKNDQPELLISLESNCEFRLAKKIDRDVDGAIVSVSSLNDLLEATDEKEWINPPFDVPQQTPATTALRVGLIDSGINYQLSEINQRLAVDAAGQMIGYDFWDMDALPFDAHPLGYGFRVQRHGTKTASLLLREAPDIALVSYRYPRPDMTRMAALISHASENNLSIIGMPLGGIKKQEWVAFEQAALKHPEILFIASAGNNGLDIDDSPVYPASLALNNMLVVTSANDFVRPAERTNWGYQSVDFMLPAEKLSVLNFEGDEVIASGSSYAVARLTAQAANLKLAHPGWTTQDLIDALIQRVDISEQDWVSAGYIADPIAGTTENDTISLTIKPAVNVPTIDDTRPYMLTPDFLVLDPAWSDSRIAEAVASVRSVFEQCGISVATPNVISYSGPDYLRDLSVGHAHTLLKAVRLETNKPLVVLARDTLMAEQFTGEAFGLGNTRTRPWLRYSVWLTENTDDEGLAIAHELYHIIANSGEHLTKDFNLMRADTHPGNSILTPMQCEQAVHFGSRNQLLQ